MSILDKDSLTRYWDDIKSIQSKRELSKANVAHLEEQLTKEQANLKQLEQDLDTCVQTFKDMINKALE